MKFYPVYLQLKGRTVLLVGAGTIALQKLSGLLDCGATVRIVSTEAIAEIQSYVAQGKATWEKRGYASSDLDGVSLVIAATDDKEVQQRVAAEARAKGLWVNVVDVPPLCDFIAPAIMGRGDIQVAVSTGGSAPALAKFLRKKLEGWIGPEYALLADVIKRVRPDILKLPKDRRDSLWECVVSDGFISEVRRDGIDASVRRLKEWIDGKPTL